jgi:hypothetical protein
MDQAEVDEEPSAKKGFLGQLALSGVEGLRNRDHIPQKILHVISSPIRSWRIWR